MLLERCPESTTVTFSKDFAATHMMCQAGRISKKIQILCDALLLHPVLVLRKSRMVVGSMEMGNFSHVAKKYIPLSPI